VWDLGPVEVMQDPGSSLISIVCLNETLSKSFITVQDFKQAVLSGISVPITIKFSVVADRGPYGFDNISFDDQAVCCYNNTVFSGDKTTFNFDVLAKGKELKIFNGNANNSQQSGNKKPLLWASILKGNLH
jgi:hypothetical protein